MSVFYSLHVLYSPVAAHPTTTAVFVLSASLCIFIYFGRRQRRRSRLHPKQTRHLADAPADASASPVRAGTAANPAPKKRITAQEKKDAKIKRRLEKRETGVLVTAAAVTATKPRTPASVAAAVASTSAKRSHEASASTLQSEATIMQKHAHPARCHSEIKVPSEPAVPRDLEPRPTASPPRAVSPSTSETTTATTTATAATVQSSTLVLTPSSSVLPVVALPPETESPEKLLDEDTPRADEETVHVTPIDKGKKREEQDGLQLDVADAPREVPSAFDKFNLDPKRATAQNSPVLIPPVAPNDNESAHRSSRPLNSVKAEAHPRASHSRSNSIATTAASSSAWSKSSVSYGSSGGVVLGIPQSSSTSSLRPSPTSSPSRLHPTLPPRYRRRHQEQPGQPPLSPFPAVNVFGYPGYIGPPTPGSSGMRSTPSSPTAFSFSAGPSTPWIQEMSGMPYPRTMPPSILSPHPFSPGPPPLHHHAHVVPTLPFDNLRSHSATELSYLANMTPSSASSRGRLDADHRSRALTNGVHPPHQCASALGAEEDYADEDHADSSDSMDETEEPSDAHSPVDYPTLNPTPSKRSKGRKKRQSKARSDSGLPGSGAVPSNGMNGCLDPNPSSSSHYVSYPPQPPDVFSHPNYHPYPSSPSSLLPFFPTYPHPPTLALPPRPDPTPAPPAWLHSTSPTNLAPFGDTNGRAYLEKDGKEGALSVSGPQDGQQLHLKNLEVDVHSRAHSRLSESTGSTSSYTLSTRAGTITPNSTPSGNPSPRMPTGHLHPLAPASHPPQRRSSTPNPHYGPLLPPNAPFMRAGSTPSPVPMAPGWYAPNSAGGGAYLVPRYPVWMHPSGYPVLHGPPCVGTPGGGDLVGPSSPPSGQPPSRSASPFVHPAGPPAPSPMGYQGQFFPPPHPSYGYTPHPPFSHGHGMTSLPPAPSIATAGAGANRQNTFPVLPPITPRSRKNTTTDLPVFSPLGNDTEDEVSKQLMEAILKNPESIKASSSVSSGRSSRAGSQSTKALSDVGGSEKGGSSCESPTIEEAAER